MVYSDRGPMRPVWALAYRAVAHGVSRLLTGGTKGATVYLRGSCGWDEVHHGLSDIDLAIIAPAVRRNAVATRWRRITGLLPSIQRLIQLGIYDPDELATVSASSTITAVEPVHLGPATARDQAGVRLRPGVGQGPTGHWRTLSGQDRRPPAPPNQPLHVNAWLELQSVWRDAFRACLRPAAPTTRLLCVKLVADPARILLATANGAQPVSRTAVLTEALRRLPDEAQIMQHTLGRAGRLHRSDPSSLGIALDGCLRISNRIARQLQDSVTGTTDVQLRGVETELALQADPLDGMRRIEGHSRLLPLADWRARCWPLHPDDAFAPTALNPADPTQLRDAVRSAGGYGPYPTLMAGELMIVAGPGLLRAVQCRMTDPVSFALAERASIAQFPNVAGWSVEDCARRAVLEHGNWLGSHPEGGTSLLRQWMRAQARTSAPGNDVLGWLLSAARAGLFLQSIEAGRPELHVTVGSAASRLGLSDAFVEYQARRLDGRQPSATTVLEVRECVLRQPAYAYQFPSQRRAVPVEADGC
jgi:hypothetical protein